GRDDPERPHAGDAPYVELRERPPVLVLRAADHRAAAPEHEVERTRLARREDDLLPLLRPSAIAPGDYVEASVGRQVVERAAPNIVGLAAAQDAAERMRRGFEPGRLDRPDLHRGPLQRSAVPVAHRDDETRGPREVHELSALGARVARL